MKPYRLILVCAILSLIFVTSCDKRQLPGVDKSVRETKARKAQLEKQETNSLLEELKQKNPFRPDHAVGSFVVDPHAGNVLKGIFWDDQKPFAILGDNVVMEGDYVDNKKVIKIDKHSVILDDNGKKEILRLQE